MEFIARFNYKIVYIEEKMNLIAGALLHYYHSDRRDKQHSNYEYVTSDARLDPDGEDLP